MPNLPIYERIIWFDRRVRSQKFPNATALSDHFEISSKTARRNIDFLRDRLGAPLEYDPGKRGYFYSDHSFALPFFQAGQEEILSILIARNLLSQSAGGMISKSIHRFSKKLFSEIRDIGLTEERLDEAFSASWTGYSPASSSVFTSTSSALLNSNLLAFTYMSPGDPLSSDRITEPHHLQHYMGSWVLIAWCRMRNDWRKFYLSRMTNVKTLAETFIPKSPEQWKYQINNSFGIFQDEETRTVTLKFTPFRAGWIKEQIWHPAQKMEFLPDGSLNLTLPVSDFREIKLKILQFGADVQVIEPAELRDEIRREIERMVELYQNEN